MWTLAATASVQTSFGGVGVGEQHYLHPTKKYRLIILRLHIISDLNCLSIRNLLHFLNLGFVYTSYAAATADMGKLVSGYQASC